MLRLREMKRRYAFEKWVLWACLALLVSYPHVELSRLIIWYWAEYGLLRPFYLELIILGRMGDLYVSAYYGY